MTKPMYHSHLLIDTGTNPDRENWRAARMWLRNLYRVHQRLAMAFPSKEVLQKTEEDKKKRLAAYCKPYDPGQFYMLEESELATEGAACEMEAEGAACHTPRGARDGFLFRIDHDLHPSHPGRRPMIVVQSALKPDWDLAFGLDPSQADRKRPVGNAGYLLAAPPQICEVEIKTEDSKLVLLRPECDKRKELKHIFAPGDRVRFRLRASPSVCRDGKRHRPRVDDELYKSGNREAIESERRELHEQWLKRKLDGALADKCELKFETLVYGWGHGWRSKYEQQEGRKMLWWSVLYEGSFRVGDTAALAGLLKQGIGPAKAFGFGLLSLCPAHPTSLPR